MPEDEVTPGQDSENTDPIDEEEVEGSEEKDSDPQAIVKQLQSELAELRTQQQANIRDLTAAMGRFRSDVAKLSEGRGDTGKTEASLKAVQSQLSVLLSDPNIDPEIRAKAEAAQRTTAAEAEAAELRARLEALERPKTDSAPQDDAKVWEDRMVEEIESYDLNPDDDIFDWKGETTRLYRTNGPAAAARFLRSKIRESIAEKEAQERRQTRRRASDERTPPAGARVSPLDKSLPKEKQMENLARILRGEQVT